jgi:DNA-binding response OmpR family regulator
VVLVVEDNADMARYIHTVLGDRYAVLHAADGVEGFEMAELHVPDLIVTDVMMPRKDGYALTADIRAAVATSHIPVIMLTARAADRDRIEGIRTGADAYLAKPFNEEELVVRIEKLLESRARLMEVYSGALLAGSAVGENGTAGAEVEQNLAFLSNLSTTVTEHIADQDYFPDGLAADICLSRSQLNRKLKAMTGHTVSSFVMLTRMNRAEQMLSAGGMNISEVAMACGFDNMSYFTRSFRETFGYTPSQYLKKSYISNPFK